MITAHTVLAIAGLTLVGVQAVAMEPLSDREMSDIQGQAYNLAFDNIQFVGEAGPNGETAGSTYVEGTDGSSLTRERYRFSADAIGTYSSPLTLEAATSTYDMNSLEDGDVVADGDDLGDLGVLRVGLPDRSAWQDVDIQYDAVYGNPDRTDTDNPNIAAGGTPSADGDFGRVTIDNIALTGTIDVTGIPDGYKIVSQSFDDGSAEASSRQGLLLNVNLDELSIDRWLLESQQEDGVFNPASDIVLRDFRLSNLQLKGATIETTPQGYRIAYSDPQPFTEEGLPDTGAAAYDPARPKASLSIDTQMTRGQANAARIDGMTLDHFVFNVRN